MLAGKTLATELQQGAGKLAEGVNYPAAITRFITRTGYTRAIESEMDVRHLTANGNMGRSIVYIVVLVRQMAYLAKCAVA